MRFSEKLRQLMESNGESSYRLAKEIECSQSTISNWLKGINVPTRAKRRAIANHYGVSYEELSQDEETVSSA